MFKEVTYGMVGGDLKALIGECHRKALGLDPRAKLVCGCFSAIDELNDECAEAYHVDKSRVYYNAEDRLRLARSISFPSARRTLCITPLPRPFWSTASTSCVRSPSP